MSDVIRQILLESNNDLLCDVELLIAVIEQGVPPQELKAYHDTVHQNCQDLYHEIVSNLDKIKNKPSSSFRTLLSETLRLNSSVILYNQHFIGPLCRHVPEDRLPLRILNWLYNVHAISQYIPVAVTNSDFRVWPEIDKPTLYGVPVSTQKRLLYLPLLFHEFGHQLFVWYQSELDRYIRDLQREIETLLTPWRQGSDEHAARDRSRRGDIVGTWYYWCQELFCDAVGLTIGGPAFLYALDRYVRISEKLEYHAPRRSLTYSVHPIFRLRVKLLVDQARELKCLEVANLVEQNWDSLAAMYQAKEDYYGFYDDAYFSVIQNTLKQMLQEVGPYRFTYQDLSSDDWTSASTPVHLLNRAWSFLTTSSDNYIDWEQEMIDIFCAE